MLNFKMSVSWLSEEYQIPLNRLVLNTQNRSFYERIVENDGTNEVNSFKQFLSEMQSVAVSTARPTVSACACMCVCVCVYVCVCV